MGHNRFVAWLSEVVVPDADIASEGASTELGLTRFQMY